MKQLYLFTFFVFLCSSIQAQDFEFFVRTTTPNETFTIPTVDGLYTYDYDVEIIQPFGGNTLATYNNVTGSLTHTFANPNTYLIKILEDSVFPAIRFSFSPDRDKITNIARWGNNEWATMESAFENCTNLTLGASNTPNLTNVTSTNKMFKNATLLVDFQDKIGEWDMSNVRDMEQMFRDCTSFNEDLSNWDTSSVQILHRIFQGATPFDQDLGNWDVSNVTGTAAIFRDTALSTSNYDKIIIGWGTLDSGETQIPTGLSIRADATHYCTSEAVRTTLSNAPYSWVFTDAGLDCGTLPDENFFITTWETTNANESITIPTTASGFNYYIDWGDGTTAHNVTTLTPHTYATPGTHTIKIFGDFPRIFFDNGGDKNKIKSIDQWGTIQWASMADAFRGARNLKILATDAPDLSRVTSLSRMFDACTSLENPDLSNWNVSTITTMGFMFNGATNFNGNITNWDVGNCTRFAAMFQDNFAFNQDIGNWNIGENITSSGINLNSMLNDATSFNQNLGNWDISNVTIMGRHMFRNSAMSIENYDATLIGWATLDTGETQIPNDIVFGGAGLEYCEAIEARVSLQAANNWTFIESTIGCPEEDKFIMVWKTTTPNEEIKLQLAGSNNFYHVDWGDRSAPQENVVTHTYAQPGTYEVKLTGDFRLQYNNLPADTSTRLKLYEIKQWGTNQWSSTEGAFYGCENLKITATDVPDLSQVASMKNMFKNCYALEDLGGQLGTWDVSRVSNFNQMFYNSLSFDYNLGNWDISNATDMGEMFQGVTLSKENYDNTLIGWATLSASETAIPSDLAFDGGNSMYCLGEAAKNTLTDVNGLNWTISDAGLDCSDAFIMTWSIEANGTVPIPINNFYEYDYNVSWGDGSTSNNLTRATSHEYTNAGTYEIKINGKFPAILYNNRTAPSIKSGLQTIEQWGTQEWLGFSFAFSNCDNLKLNADDMPNLSSVTSLSYMFGDSENFEDLKDNIGSWDVSNIEDISSMFRSCSIFNENISNWTFTQLVNTNNTFSRTNLFNQDISNWNVSTVKNMSSMFFQAKAFNQDLNQWDVSSVENMDSLFELADVFDQNLADWDISSAERMTDMFLENGISQENYDATLIGWATLEDGETKIPANVSLDTDVTYCAAQDARALLTGDTYNWEINDGGNSCDFTDSFITTWQTATDNDTITIPTTDDGYNYSVDWGDGTIETGFTGDAPHTYDTAGSYEVKITGDFPRIYFNNSGDKDKILEVKQWGTIVWASMQNSFFGCSNLDVLASDIPDLSMVSSLTSMFRRCTSLGTTTSNSVNWSWDTKNVTRLDRMFELTKFNHIGIVNWDVGNVTNFGAMFLDTTPFNQDISGWNIGEYITAGYINMTLMFAGTFDFNQPIGLWDMSKVNNIHRMFRGTRKFNQSLNSWDVSNVTNMNGVFEIAVAFNQSLSNWDIGKVDTMENMLFSTALSIANYDATLIGWAQDTSGVANDGDDDIPSNITLTATGSPVRNISDLLYCFGAAARNTLTDVEGLNWSISDGGLDCGFEEGFITTWQTTEVDETIVIPTTGDGYNYSVAWGDGSEDNAVTGDASHSFTTPGTYTVKIKGDFPRIRFRNFRSEEKIQTIEQWGTQEWTSMSGAFYGCSNLVLEATDTPILTSTTSLEFMFSGATALEDTQDVMNTWDVSTIINMQYMFNGATTFNENIANWDVGNVNNFNNMFSKASNFNQNIETWNIGEHVPDLIGMIAMFSECTAFNQPLNNWDMSKVGGISEMFRLAKSFNQPLDNWDASKVQNMVFTFIGAEKFNQNLGSWDISSVTDMSFMLGGTALTTENYDATLKGWATLDEGEAKIPINVGYADNGLTYCEAAYERNELDTTYQWIFRGSTSAERVCENESAFITTWSVIAGDLSIEIPTTGDGYLYSVDWGDGTVENGFTGNATHTYTPNPKASRFKQIKITGSFPRIYFNNSGDKDKIVSIDQWGTQQWTSMESAFYGCTNLIIDTNDTPDLANVTSLRAMFRDNTNLIDVQGTIANWDVRTIVDLGQMFMNTDKFNTTLKSWFLGAAEDLSEMFRGAKMFNQLIGFPYFAKTFEGMFRDAIAFNQPIYWTTPEVITLKDMFNGATSFDQNLRLFKIQSVTDMTGMFSNAGLSTQNYDQTLSGWFLSDLRPSDITFDAGNSKYCLAGDIKEQLTNTYGWQITDGGSDCDENDIFVMTWDLSTERSFNMPTSGDGYDYTVHLSTGDIYHITSDIFGIGRSENLGMLTVRIYGDFPRFNFDKRLVDKEKLATIEHWGSLQLLEADGAFDGCTNLVLNADDVPDLSQLSSTAAMFRDCTSLVDSKDTMKDWDVSTIQNTSSMFENCTAFNEPIGNWTMDSVEDMEGMFQSATSFNQDISNWNVSNVANFEDLFLGATDFNQPLANWDISAANDMDDMLVNSGMTQENYDATLIGWATLEDDETQIPTNFTLDASATYCLAEDARTLLTSDTYQWIINDGGKLCESDAFITTWQINEEEPLIIPIDRRYTYNYTIDWGDGSIETDITTSATHTYANSGQYKVKIYGDFPSVIFNLLGDLRPNLLLINQWGTHQWETLESAFKNCINLKLDADDVPDFSKVRRVWSMFSGCTNFEDLKDQIGNWDMTGITSITSMFRDCIVFDEDITGWTFTKLDTTSSTFFGATAFDQDISSWDMSKVNNLDDMFKNATSFNQPIGNWTLGIVDYINNIFEGATSFNQDLSSWDFSNVYVAHDMFNGASAFDQDLSSWDISNVEEFDNIFTGSGMSQQNYDATLIGWATLDTASGETQIPENLTLDADATYCLAEDARALLTSDTYKWTINDEGLHCTEEANINVYLLGAALNPKTGEEQLMRDDLRRTAVMPSTSPYSDTIKTSESVLDNTSNTGDTIVDWVWVELRDPNDSTILIEGRSALLQRDGDVVDIDGNSPVDFVVDPGAYYVVVNHRNHLAIRSKSAIVFDGVPVPIDFSSSPSTIEGGLNAVTQLPNGKYAMYAGDVDGNGQTQNSDITNARNQMGTSGYNTSDADMNGQIQNTDINSIIRPCVGKAQQF